MRYAKVLPKQFGSPLRWTVQRVAVCFSYHNTRRSETAHDPHVARHVSECGLWGVNRHLKRGPFFLIGAQRNARYFALASYVL